MRRRALLAGLGAGAVALAGCAGSACQYSPATVLVFSDVEGAHTVDVTVERDGEELFSGTEHQVTFYARFDERVDIGCTFPVTATVTVDVEGYGRSTTEVTFPAPPEDLPSNRRSAYETELQITLTARGIEMAVDYV